MKEKEAYITDQTINILRLLILTFYLELLNHSVGINRVYLHTNV